MRRRRDLHPELSGSLLDGLDGADAIDLVDLFFELIGAVADW